MGIHPFIESFSDVMSDTVTVTPGYVDYTGVFVASGSTFAPNCYIEGEERMARTSAGEEKLSCHQLFLDDDYALDPATHRFTLPARYNPRLLLEAISIVKANDEEGAEYEIVMLP